jgi:single-strand DNA-binding protein
MASLNKVLLIGNLTRDPQLKYIPSGTAVADLGLAINNKWTGKDGQKHEETTFVDVTVWARGAELAGEYLHKGDPVFIEGRLQLDQWQDKDGQKRQRLRVVSERWQFLPRAGGPGAQRGSVADDQGAPPAEEFGEPAPAAGPGDNIPF